MKVEQNISKEFLLDQYVKQNKSIQKISKEIRRSAICVKVNLLRYGIPIRKHKTFTKELLIEEYVVKFKSTHQIAQEQGTSHTIILRKLKEHDIPRRSCSRLGRRNVCHYPSEKPISQGYRFGKLTTVKKIEIENSPEEWTCLCDCGTTIIVRSMNLRKNRVKSCGCLKNTKLDGYKGISGNLCGCYKRGAKNRNLPFEITPKDMWDIFIKQEGKCALSGVSIVLNPDRTASLDRIDSKKGYTKSNVQWVHKIINTMKWNIDCDQFVEWCKIVAKNNS